MSAKLEQTVLETFRNLSVEKQKDVLQFLDLIQQDLPEKQTDEEIKQAREILNKAKKQPYLALQLPIMD